MHRIDSLNARADENGAGKNGFNDNTDISGMDSTYMTPEWCNAIQEELANVIAEAGIALNKAHNNQLLAGVQYLFQTYTDAEVLALATAMQDALDNEAAIRAAADLSEATLRAEAISAILLKIGAVGSVDLQTQIDDLSEFVVYPRVLARGNFDGRTMSFTTWGTSGWDLTEAGTSDGRYVLSGPVDLDPEKHSFSLNAFSSSTTGHGGWFQGYFVDGNLEFLPQYPGGGDASYSSLGSWVIFEDEP